MTGKAKINKVKVKGSKKVKRNKKSTYKVTIKNNGAVAAKNVKVKMTGKGVTGKANAGSIAAGKSKTVKVKAKFKKKGKIKTNVKVTSKNGGRRPPRRPIKVS